MGVWRERISSCLSSRRVACVASLALALLVLGTLVYTLDRPAGSALGLPWPIAPTGLNVGAFGVLGGSLPSFAHTFAFSLIHGLVLVQRASRTARLATLARCCAGWALVETAFECGQHPALAQALATWSQYFHENGDTAGKTTTFVVGYFVHGRFDPLDVIAILLGAGTSFLLASWALDARERRAAPTSNQAI